VHELRVWMRDPGVALDRITLTREPADFGNFRLLEPIRGASPRYRAAAPPESFYRVNTTKY
jgi:hypothetical protein